ncbi:hypothetical protein WP50_23575 [Lactiplantibacillus plantarum]|nr:hypothetical protein WP50_23575 [Lactiplantibacillus plantarum]
MKKEITLNNGLKMPVLGFGVFQIPDFEECKQAVLTALKQGYRLIDTAAAYGNERAVGAAIRESGIAREEISWLGDSPEPYHNPILKSFRQAADRIEQSDLNYTIIRPGWYNNGPINYEITQKGESFGGHDVSRDSIADYVMKLITEPALDNRASVGINTPE